MTANLSHKFGGILEFGTYPESVIIFSLKNCFTELFGDDVHHRLNQLTRSGRIQVQSVGRHGLYI
jgi:hypothetical protein